MQPERKVLELNINDVLPNRFQPRLNFEEDKINDLAASVKEHGVIQPIVVRPIADKFEIIAGERRYKASVMAGKTTIPAIIANLNDKESAEVALIENVQRQDLTPIEEAVSYKKILDMGYINQEELAKKLGKSQAAVANKLRLLNLDEEVQEALLNNKISERHARSLLKLEESKQKILLERIINERLTVRKTDEEIKKMQNNQYESLEQIDLDIYDRKEEEPRMDNREINPGFVDINNIQNKAEDIFKEIPKAPIEEFLEPSPIKMEPVKEEEPVTNGKFFNLGNEEPETIADFNIPKQVDETLHIEQPVEIMNIKPQEEKPVNNINIAVEKVKTLIAELKSMGIDVEVNEFDLDSMYQLILKINK